MEAKTQLQRRITALSGGLAEISYKQKVWAEKNIFPKYVYRTKKDLTCFECGHYWKADGGSLMVAITGCTCPQCGEKLVIRTDKKRKLHDSAYYCITERCKEFQVVRFFMVWQNCRLGQHAKYTISEVVQQWITEDLKVTVVALKVQGLSQYIDQWCYGSDFAIRGWNERYNINPYKVYPGYSSLPIFKRNGFRGKFHSIGPMVFFRLIMNDPKAETLIKAGQYSLLKRLSNTGISSRIWAAVKICIRNNYTVKDASMWDDYIHLLIHFGKDIHNSKYVCPDNLPKEHDRLVAKKKKIDQQKRLESLRNKIDKAQSKYLEQKSKFFSIILKDGDIEIKPIETVEEFMIEGDELGHCVFANEYYNKPDSLIMSAKKNGKRIETVEVSIKNLEVIQARGLRNSNTEYHDRILNLVKKNINVIKERASAKTTQTC